MRLIYDQRCLYTAVKLTPRLHELLIWVQIGLQEMSHVCCFEVFILREVSIDQQTIVKSLIISSPQVKILLNLLRVLKIFLKTLPVRFLRTTEKEGY